MSAAGIAGRRRWGVGVVHAAMAAGGGQAETRAQRGRVSEPPKEACRPEPASAIVATQEQHLHSADRSGALGLCGRVEERRPEGDAEQPGRARAAGESPGAARCFGSFLCGDAVSG